MCSTSHAVTGATRSAPALRAQRKLRNSPGPAVQQHRTWPPWPAPLLFSVAADIRYGLVGTYRDLLGDLSGAFGSPVGTLGAEYSTGNDGYSFRPSTWAWHPRGGIGCQWFFAWAGYIHSCFFGDRVLTHDQGHVR